MRIRYLRLLLALLFSTLLSSQSAAGRITVAVASNFAGTLEELAQIYEKTAKEDEIVVVPGATGKLSAQIIEGAPFDIFLAADDKAPSAIAREGKAVAESEFTYAIGKLALWSADARLRSQTGEGLLKARISASWRSPTPLWHPMAWPRNRRSDSWGSMRFSRTRS